MNKEQSGVSSMVCRQSATNEIKNKIKMLRSRADKLEKLLEILPPDVDMPADADSALWDLVAHSKM